MARIRWTRDLEIGIPFVDADHKVLVSLLDQAQTCIDQREETTMLGSVLAALVEYTEYHFAREEKLLDDCGFQAMEAHRETHRGLAADVSGLHRRFQEDPRSIEADEVRDFLRNWLVEHIIGHDFAYRQECAGRAEAAVNAEAMIFPGAGGGSSGPAWGRLRVLVVDDNPNMIALVKTFLNAVGVRRVEAADSGINGLARLAKRPADVVLCDWVMEDMDGGAFARHVQEMGIDTRVVMLTGYSVDVMQDRSSGLGVSEFLEKPISPTGLLETLAHVAGERRA